MYFGECNHQKKPNLVNRDVLSTNKRLKKLHKIY